VPVCVTNCPRPIRCNSRNDQPPTVTLSTSRDFADGSPVTALPHHLPANSVAEDKSYTAPPTHRPASQGSSSSPRPPPFSSLYFPPESELSRIKASVTEAACGSVPAFAPAPSFEEAIEEDSRASAAEAATKAALPQDPKRAETSGKGVDDGEPPPPYTEGSSPLDSFSYVMAAAGGAASIITQVQQTGGPPINTLGGQSIQGGL